MNRLNSVSIMSNEECYSLKSCLKLRPGREPNMLAYFWRNSSSFESLDGCRNSFLRYRSTNSILLSLRSKSKINGVLREFKWYSNARGVHQTRRCCIRPANRSNGWYLLLGQSLPEHIDEVEDLLTENRIWKTKTVDIGIVSSEDALNWCTSGEKVVFNVIKENATLLFKWTHSLSCPHWSQR